MQILVYEFVTGGGTWSTDGELAPAGSLLTEGTAMLHAVVEDLVKLPKSDIIVLRDSRLRNSTFPGHRLYDIANRDQEMTALLEIGSRVDGVVVIAPETHGLLQQRCELLELSGATLFSPSSIVVQRCTSKHETAINLTAQGIPTPQGWLFSDPESSLANLAYPAVMKPLDGCGSMNIRLVKDQADLVGKWRELQVPVRVEAYHPGLAASVAVLCGPKLRFPLPAATQRLSEDGCFRYLGGELPLPTELNQRAQLLALRAVNTLPSPVGFIGVDLVLGDEPNGRDDVVIEMNPRLTTSYVGLRQLCRGNLGKAMLDIAVGEPHELSFRSEGLEFDADGTIRR